MPPLPRPSAFTPFARRFTDERARDLTDTIALYQQVKERYLSAKHLKPGSRVHVGGTIYSSFREQVPDALDSIFCQTLDAILALEKPMFEFPVASDFAHLSLKEQVDLRHFLRAKEHILAHEMRTLDLLLEGCQRMFGGIAELLPQSRAPSPFTIPLVYTLPDPRILIERICATWWEQTFVDAGLFVEVCRRIYFNICEVSGVVPGQETKRPLKLASKSTEPLDEVVRQYLGGTPLCDLPMAPVPLKFTYEGRYSHMHVLGGSGAGKTTLLQNLILSDLMSDDPPSLVIVDGQGDLINKLSHLALFDPDYGELASRIFLITPKDTKSPPALNIFDVNHDRLGQYDEATKEQVTAGVIQTFDYLFAGLLGADLTAKQGVFFRFVARLMLALPETLGRNATILDMIALMDDAAPYQKAIESLPPIQRNFFERDFASKTFAQTKEQIRYRLNAILENPTLARLFTSPETKIDLFDVLNNGGIVLVDTAKDFLKGLSGHFGRIFISLVLQAVLERAVIPEHKRRPTFLIVDEAAAYFDSNMDDFLTEARKYKCGCVFAHQFLDQATPALKASLAANTTIKFAGGVSTSDARALASDMRTTAEFILSQPRLHFGCHIRNITPNAVSIPVPVGVLERQPKLTGEAYEKLRERHRLRVSLPQPVHGATFTFEETMGSQTPDDPPRRHHEFRPGAQTSNDSSAATEEW
jgi:hypothetical protein